MRRGVSVAMLMVLLTGVFVPVALASPASVPACCRVGAKHHCEMSMGDSDLTGFKSAVQSCPYRIAAAVTSQLVALTTNRQALAAFVVQREAAQSTRIALHASQSDDAHKRGPPTA